MQVCHAPDVLTPFLILISISAGENVPGSLFVISGFSSITMKYCTLPGSEKSDVDKQTLPDSAHGKVCP